MNRGWVLASCLSLLVACGDDDGSVDGGGGDAAGRCSTDLDCDDGLFCNGPEVCLPDDATADVRGCAQAGAPCLEGQRCDEAAMMCLSVCSVIADADGDGIDAVECGGADCDDTNANRYPGNVEVCDDAGVDEDCDATTVGARDADGDGFVDALCCNDDGAGGLNCGDDCSDSRRDMRPGFAETCDFLDNDCDGTADEGATVSGFADNDRDLHGDPSMPMEACPGTPGFSVENDDCNDEDHEVHGAQLEICDGKDNNCNGMTDEAPAAVTWYPDDDGDGFGVEDARAVVSCEPVPGFSIRPSDCDDNDRFKNPGAEEQCNGIDDDCDGRADFRIAPGNLEDDDGDGIADVTCGGSDCDDANAAVFPGAPELCDGIDNDCDGVADGADAMALWLLDLDGDGYGDDSMPAIEDCDPQPARVPRGGDCDDSSAQIHPGVSDLCDGVDDDCDGDTDENAFRVAYYTDADDDEFGTGGVVEFRCIDGLNLARNPGDCDDGNPVTFPTATEICDMEDNDCDMTVDEDAPILFYPDVDGDGFGAMGATGVEMCGMPAGLAPNNTDCDDGDGANFPGNPESCDNRDNDCDGTADNGADAACVVASGTGSCSAGACSLGGCDVGFDNCDGEFDSGCEVATASNPTHCGGCDMGCALGDTCGLGTAGMCDVSGVAELVAGEAHTFFLRSTGGLLGWGANGGGRVGNGGTTNVPVPTLIRNGILQVAAGISHSCAVTNSRRAMCWGTGSQGELGDGFTLQRHTPVFVSDLGPNVRKVGAGNDHSCALLLDGSVWCWGRQVFGQLGDGVVANTRAMVPQMVLGIDDATDIHVGLEHTCVLRPLGGGGTRVQCWGNNSLGTLCIGATGGSMGTPVDAIGLPTDLIEFAPGAANRSCVRLTSGGLRCWGSSGLGALANGDTSMGTGVGGPVVTTEVGGAEVTNIVAACTHEFSTCVLRDDGATPGAHEVWCSGADDVGQMGDGDPSRNDRGRLQPVVDETGTGRLDDAVAVSCGRRHTCAARASGEVLCWGNDQQHSLGNGGTTPVNVPTPTPATGLP